MTDIPPVSDVVAAFERAMNDAGYYPRGGIEVDTKNFVRFDAPGDKAGRQNGFYKLKTGEYPVGWFGDWKVGEQEQWFFRKNNDRELTKKEREHIKRETAKLKAEAAQATETRQAEVAEKASFMWSRADGNVEGHQYLERKGIKVPRGLRIYTARDGARLLAVPMYAFDMNGQPQLTNLQLIDGSGNKRFLAGGRVEGCFYSIKGDSALIAICEGYATADAIWESTGVSVVAAFNSGNLVPVARDFARHRPIATLMICGDDDVIAPDDWAEKGRGRPWVNAGRKKAEAAAQAIGCKWIMPVFRDGAARDRTDFDDLRRLEGEQAVAGQVLGALRSVEAEESEPGTTVKHVDQVQDESWRSKIPQTSQGSPDGANVEGVALYIANHRHLKGRLRYNQLTKEMELDGNPLEDYHVAEFRRIMHAERFKAKKGDVQDEMEAESRRNQFDPLVQYLQGLKWDETPRIDRWLSTYLGAVESDYTRVVGRKFLIGAVARALNPGCKMDNMLVAEGDQNIGKSTAFRYLFGDRFFTDHLPDFHSKDSFLQLQGAWCVEVAELSAMTKADVKDVKQFLSRLVDKYRPPYGRMAVHVPRRTVFVGTVNPEEGGYLKDTTGNRRFWPFAATNVNLAAILKDRDQLWAEAVHAFIGGETWHLTDEHDLENATAEQAKRREVHPWEATIGKWLLENSLRVVDVPQVLTNGVKMPPEKQEARHARQVGACMRALGWVPSTDRLGDKPRRVFYSAEAWKERQQGMNVSEFALPPVEERGPQDDDDVPF